MKAVDGIHQRGGKITELVSLCGGLPDPVAADNPMRYKISWSPLGVLRAAKNKATYMKQGNIIEIPAEKLLQSVFPSDRFPTMRLETVPNRESLAYRELYGVPDVHTICRGTLRYEGRFAPIVEQYIEYIA
jgi:saccharopine dehydrogenase (NADP+, L-glutamate forming)